MKWIVLVSLIAANLVRLPAPVVRISSGLVRGRISENGKFYEYLGIPYGTVDERNRFQAPLPPPKWDGIFDALDENTWCPQRFFVNTFGDTNCLQLNIYTPIQTSHTKTFPVMVFIHGGCFFGGSGSPFLYGGDMFAENDVVFVSINYRLSVEGFLCLGIKEAPGNAGLKDQIAALRWIKENIQGFGGNPNDVTLFGESAGAVSTSFMILSPAARGLFHKAILQSGSSLAPWAMQHDPIATASALVKKLGYNTKDPYEIHSIISKRTASELIEELKSMEHKYCVADRNLFAPCVEKEIDGIEPVLTEFPTDVIKSGNYSKVPMIIGYTDSEGIFFVSADYGTSLVNSTSTLDPLNIFQRDLDFLTEFDKNCTEDRVKRHYFSGQNEMIMNMVDLYSDLYFKFPLILESELYSNTTNQPIYYYLFKYNGLVNMPKFISGFGLDDGACHADELFYLFKPHGFPLPWRLLDNEMTKKMLTLWTNFAKYGDPTPKPTKLLPFRWSASREWNPRALVIDTEITTGKLWDHRSVAFWNDTYNRYRRRNYGFKDYF